MLIACDIFIFRIKFESNHRENDIVKDINRMLGGNMNNPLSCTSDGFKERCFPFVFNILSNQSLKCGNYI